MRVVSVGLKTDDLKRFLLANRYAVILLVNLNMLKCHLCKEKQRKDWWAGWLKKAKKAPVVVPSIPDASLPSNPIPVPVFNKEEDVPRSYTPTKQPTAIRQLSPQQLVPRRLSFSLFPSSPSSLATMNSNTPLLSGREKERDRSTCLGVCTLYGKKGFDLISSTEFIGHFIVLIG